VSEMEIIDVNAQIAHLHLNEAIEYAITTVRKHSHPAWARFTISNYEVTVAEDSDALLLRRTVWAHYDKPKSGVVKIGPYPPQLTFEEAKAASYQLVRGKDCLAVRAYQLNQTGWVERVNSEGETFSHWHAIADDWYVKDPDTARIFVMPHADFMQRSRPST